MLLANELMAPSCPQFLEKAHKELEIRKLTFPALNAKDPTPVTLGPGLGDSLRNPEATPFLLGPPWN